MCEEGKDKNVYFKIGSKGGKGLRRNFFNKIYYNTFYFIVGQLYISTVSLV